MRRAHQFESERQPATLTTGKETHETIANVIESHRLEHGIEPRDLFVRREAGDPKPERSLDVFPNREALVGDAELRHIANFMRIEIAFLGKVAAIPLHSTHGVLEQAGNDLQ